MRAFYRIVAALLAVVSGFLIAWLITVVLDDRQINWGWWAAFAAGAVLLAGVALMLWSQAGRRGTPRDR